MAAYGSNIRNSIEGKDVLAKKMLEKKDSKSNRLSETLINLSKGIKKEPMPLALPELDTKFIKAYERNCESCRKKVKGIWKVQSKYKSTALWEMNSAYLCDTCLNDLPNMNLRVRKTCSCGEEFWSLKFIGDTFKHTRCKQKQNLLRVNCAYCGNAFSTIISRKQKFCDTMCATFGRQSIRSKMELEIEIRIRRNFNMTLQCNNFTIISDYLNNGIMLELDFWFPELKFAVELNGGFHRKSLNEDEKALQKRKDRDQLKEKVCKELNINLLSIDFDNDTRATKDKIFRQIKKILKEYEENPKYILEYI